MDNKILYPTLAGLLTYIMYETGKTPTLVGSAIGQALSLERTDDNYVYGVVQFFNSNGMFVNKIDPAIVLAMVKQESNFNPKAERHEKHIKNKFSLYESGDTSLGLMQTLTSTANWLYQDMGYRAYVPTISSLQEPNVSLYFGCAYIDYMLKRNSSLTVEQLAEYYNGGYGNSNKWTKIHASKVKTYYDAYKMKGY